MSEPKASESAGSATGGRRPNERGTMSETPAIDARGLVKKYGTFQALAGVDLRVEGGEVCGFLGPNGAGKSTTLRILARVERPDSGTALIAGHDVVTDGSAASHALGYMPERFAVYDTLPVEEYLEFFLELYRDRGAGKPRLPATRVVADALDLVGMTAKAKDTVGGLSKGQRQRILLARSILHDPAVLLLDEPTSGLDPRARVEFKAIVRELKRMGKAVLISSHVLPDLQDLCDRVVILIAGKVHASGRTEEIRNRLAPDVVEIKVETLDDASAARAAELVRAFEGATGVEVAGGVVTVSLAGGRAKLPELHRALVAANVPIVALDYRRTSLDDLYLQLTESAGDPESLS